MQHSNRAGHRLHDELSSITDHIDSAVESLRQLEDSTGKSGTGLPQAIGQFGQTDEESKSAANRVLDTVEAITTDAGDIVQELRVLKKTLPATYFKNRSKVRGAFERIEAKAGKTQKNAFSIMEVFQHREITTRHTEHATGLLEGLRSKLLALKESLNDTEIEGDNRDGSSCQSKFLLK